MQFWKLHTKNSGNKYVHAGRRKHRSGMQRRRRQYLSGMLVLLLTVTAVLGVPGADSRLLKGLLAGGPGRPETVWAESITDALLVDLVQQNLGDAARYEEVTTEIIENAVRNQHTDGTDWSSVNIPNVMKAIGETIADSYTGDDGATYQRNPWSEESEASEDSPYSPGVDYQGNAMNANYTLGQLMVDYARETYAGAALLTDSQIIESYNMLAAGGEEENPFVDLEEFMTMVRSAAATSNNALYVDETATDAIDRSRYITYGEYVMSRGTPIPAGYLYIGTWLMDAQTITTTFYRMAVESMSTDNQQIMLYKSELSGSYWKDIYDATGLEYILPLSESVEEASLAGYYVSIVVGADGIPRWAKTGEEADIFSIVDPYNLEELPELKSLWMLYQAGVVSASDEGSKLYTYNRLKNFFDYDSAYTRSDELKRDTEYVYGISGRTGILFYAGKSNGWYFDRYEATGRGFLESIEDVAEQHPNWNVNYTWNGRDEYRWFRYPENNAGQLISGPVCWRNEVAWRNEVNAFGGETALTNRIHNFQYLWKHYSSVHDDVTDEADRGLRNLSGVYVQLRQTGTSEDAELANEVMLVSERLDSTRRAEIYYNLVDNESHNYIIGPVLNLLYQQVAYGETSIGRNYKLLHNTTEDFSPESSIVDAVENAITECASAQFKYQSKAISQGTTISSQTEYALIQNVIDRAPEGAIAIRPDLRSLIDLDNIQNNVIAHKSRELNLLNDTLLPTADLKFQQAVHESGGESYQKAAADPNTGQQTIDEILKDQKAGVSAVAAELQQFIKARAMRLPTDEAIVFVNDRINWAESQRIGISTDAFGPYATEALDAHILWLRNLLNTIKEGGSLEEDETDWSNVKASLELELLTALDNNDLEQAESLARKIEEAELNAEEEEANKRKIINDPNASAADQIGAFDPDTPSGVADMILENALGQVADGDYDIIDALDALEGLGSPRIQELVDALTAHGAPLSMINKAKKAAENAENSPFYGRLTNIDTGDGNGDGGVGEGDNGDGSGTGGSGGTNPDGTGPNGNGGTDDTGTGTNPGTDNGPGAGGDNNDTGEPGNNGTGGDNGNGNGNDGNGGTGPSGPGGPGNGGAGTNNNGTGNNGTGTNNNGTGNNGTGNNGTGTNNNGTGNNGTGNDGTGSNGTGTGNNGTGNNGSGTGNNGTGNNGTGTGNNGTGNGGNGTGNNGTGTNNNGTGNNGTGNNGTGSNGTGTGNNGTGNNGSGTGNNGTGNNGTGTGNNGTGNGGSGTGNNGTGTNNNGTGNNGTGNNGSGTGTGGSGTGTGNNTGGGTGNGTGANGTGGTSSGIAGGPITGPGTGLKARDFDRAVQEAFRKDFDQMSPDEQAAAVVALTQFAKARDDKAAYNYMLDKLDQMQREKSPFIYRQYLEDQTQEYVSLGAVSRCRKYTRFRLVRQQDQTATMSQIVGGSASYVFTIGDTTVAKNNGTTDTIDDPVVTQEDESLYGNRTAKYPYITEDVSGKYLYDTCAYIPGTEWAVLITPQTDKKVAQLLDLLDVYADGE